MFTLKHVAPDGRQLISECEGFAYNPAGVDDCEVATLVATNVLGWGRTAHYTNGSVFIMNSNGKTVATYYFG